MEDKPKTNYVWIGIAVVAVIVLVFVLIDNFNKPNVVTQTKYVCSDGNVVESSTLCSTSPITTPQQPKTYDYFNVELDAMGARGNENSGFGDGWIDSQDCLKSNYAKDKSFTECTIQDVQILTGSDPNPLKINIGGSIFNNDVVFKIKCACSN